MQCGCAVVTAENGGHMDYAEHGRTALVVPVKNSEALAAAICQLMSDRPLGYALSQAGNAKIQNFTWDNATSALERLIRFEMQGL
jgi:glycosyltransferase involved in cell wall biosynthesis